MEGDESFLVREEWVLEQRIAREDRAHLREHVLHEIEKRVDHSRRHKLIFGADAADSALFLDRGRLASPETETKRSISRSLK